MIQIKKRHLVVFCILLLIAHAILCPGFRSVSRTLRGYYFDTETGRAKADIRAFVITTGKWNLLDRLRGWTTSLGEIQIGGARLAMKEETTSPVALSLMQRDHPVFPLMYASFIRMKGQVMPVNVGYLIAENQRLKRIAAVFYDYEQMTGERDMDTPIGYYIAPATSWAEAREVAMALLPESVYQMLFE